MAPTWTPACLPPPLPWKVEGVTKSGQAAAAALLKAAAGKGNAVTLGDLNTVMKFEWLLTHEEHRELASIKEAASKNLDTQTSKQPVAIILRGAAAASSCSSSSTSKAASKAGSKGNGSRSDVQSALDMFMVKKRL